MTKKFSAITVSPTSPLPTDTVIGVGGGTTDYQYPLALVTRQQITANTTFYISTAGDDANDGLSPGTAWLTLAHAFQYLDYNIDVVIPGNLSGIQITLDIGAGTFQGAIVRGNFSHFNGASLEIQGDSVATTTVTDGFPFFRFAAVNITITGLTMTGVNALGAGSLCFASTGTFVQVTAAKFDMGTVYNALGCAETAGGYVAIANTEITGNGDFVIFGSGSIDTLTFTGTTTFVDAVLRIPFDGNCQDNLSHTGTATGFKYTCEGTLWFPFGGGAIQSGVGTLDGTIGPGGRVFTGTDFHIKVCHTMDGGGVFNYQAPSTGFTLNLIDTDYFVIIDPSGTLATGTIVMGPAPLNGARCEIRFSQIITSLTISPNSGQSVVGAPAATTVGQVITAIYRTSNTTWYF